MSQKPLNIKNLTDIEYDNISLDSDLQEVYINQSFNINGFIYTNINVNIILIGS